MPQIINTNIASMNAQRNLDRSQSASQQAMERLSSGLRINSAKDDAAGLSISTRFISQINGLGVAVRNAGDGIALAQTAEGALSSVNDDLQRIRELAIQSANATNSDVDREALQAEVEQLVEEISRTVEETSFNGKALLDGSFTDQFQIGSNKDEVVSLSIDDLTDGKLGKSGQSGLSARGTDSALENGDLIINGVAIPASRSEDDTASTDNKAASAISKAAAINLYSEETGVTAYVNENVAAGSDMSGISGSGTFTLNGVEIEFTSSTNTSSTRTAITQAVNAVAGQTGVRALDTESAATGINLVAEDGRNIQLSFDLADLNGLDQETFSSATGLGGGQTLVSGTRYSNTFEGGYTLVANGEVKTVEISGGNGTGRGDITNSGLSTGSFDREKAIFQTASVIDISEPATIGGGSLSNQLARTDSGATQITLDAGTITNLASTNRIDLDIGGDLTILTSIGEKEFSVVDGHMDNLIEVTQSLNAAATSEGVGDLVNFFEQIDFSISSITTPSGGSTLTLAGVTLNLLDSTVPGYQEESQLENLLQQIESADFSAVVNEGFVVAELNEDRDRLDIRIKNEGSVLVRAVLGTSTQIETDMDGSGGVKQLAAGTNYLGGHLMYEATSDLPVEVSMLVAKGVYSTSVAEGAGVYSSTNVSGSPLTNTVPITIVDGSRTLSQVYEGSTVTTAAAGMNQSGKLTAWEEVSLELGNSNFEAGDTLLVGGIPVSIHADESGSVTLASIVDSINQTNFSSGNFDFFANLSEEGDSATLVVRNFSGNTLTMESQDSAGRGLSFIKPLVFVGEQPQSMSGEIKFVSSDGSPLSITLSDPSGSGELFSGTSTTVDFSGVNGLQTGDLRINDVNIGAADKAVDTASAIFSSDGSRILSSSKSLSAIAVASAINEVADKTGVSAEVKATQVVGGDGSQVNDSTLAEFQEGDQASIYINGVEVGTVTLQADNSGSIDTGRARADALDLINQVSGQTGVVATDNGVSLTLTAADGRNVSVAIDDQSGAHASIGALFGLDAAVDGIGESTFGAGSALGGGVASGNIVTAEGTTYETTYGTVSLSSASQFRLEGGSNGNDELAKLGLQVGTFGGGEDGQYLTDIDISTFEGAQSAITAVDNAIEQVARQRADLGAVQNRLESTVSNLQITSENLDAANSRILDADFATETAEMSRTQVLQQAGISVLAQANAASQQVLSLLG